MKKQLWWIVLVPLLALCGAGAWLAWARSGPRVKGPSQDPIVLLNRAHDDIGENAADYYARAYESLSKGKDEFWDVLDPWWPTDIPISTELIEWVEDHHECVASVQEGLRCDECWFTLRRSANAGVLQPELTEIRRLVQFFRLRARIAAERRDLIGFIDALRTMDGLARDVYAQPLLMSDLVGIGCLWSAQEIVALPYTWPELSSADRQVYARSVFPLFEAPPDLERALKEDFNELCWIHEMKRPRSFYSRLVFPSERIFGELDQALQPVRGHFELPVEEQMQRLGQLEERLEAWSSGRRAKPVAEAGRLLVSIALVTWPGAIQQRGWLITFQRGNRTLAAIFAHADAVGQFPASLDDAIGDFVIDPFTGKPFIYRTTDDGFTLYSAGHDGDDDGGMHHPRFGEQHATTGEALPPDGDYVFWPVQRKAE